MTEINNQYDGKSEYNLSSIIDNIRTLTFSSTAVPEDIVFKAYSLALTSLNASDFQAIKCLLSCQAPVSERLTKINDLSTAIEHCNFLAAWKLIDELKLQSFQHLRTLLQTRIVYLLSITCQTINLQIAKDLTNMSSNSELIPMLVSLGASIEGEVVIFRAVEDNTEYLRKSEENITYSEMKNILDKLNHI